MKHVLYSDIIQDRRNLSLRTVPSTPRPYFRLWQYPIIFCTFLNTPNNLKDRFYLGCCSHDYEVTTKHSNIEPFDGTYFKRWHEKVFDTLDVMNLAKSIGLPPPDHDAENDQVINERKRANKGRYTILSSLSN